MNRELDKSLVRYARLQETRRLKEQAILGEVVETAPLPMRRA